MPDVALRKMPKGVHENFEKYVRHVLELAEAFDILIAPLRLDPRSSYICSEEIMQGRVLVAMKILIH